MSTLREIETECAWEFLEQWHDQEQEVLNNEETNAICGCVPDKQLLSTG